MGFWTDATVLVTGSTGFLGRHVLAALEEVKPRRIVTVAHRDWDLTSQPDVARLFQESRPEIVLHLAGLVGGILANRDRPGDFFYRNAMMGALVFEHARLAKVRRLVAIGAGCAYPASAPVPLREESFWDGYPPPETAPYSFAKRLLHVQSSAYAAQYGFESSVVIPGNIYGPHDNFDPHTSPVLPALVRKFCEAKESGRQTLELLGTGRATRDFIYAGDCARAILLAAERGEPSGVYNVSSGEETSIRTLAESLASVVGWNGSLVWSASGPEGHARRYFDISRARLRLGFEPKTSLMEGLRMTVDWYRQSPRRAAVGP